MAEPNELNPKPLRPMDAVGDSRRLDNAPAAPRSLATSCSARPTDHPTEEPL